MKQAFLYITATALDKVRVREGNRPSFLNFSFKNKKETNFFKFFKWENCKKKSFAFKVEYLILNVT